MSKYLISSTYPPSLTRDADGYVRVHGGTVTAIQLGRLTLPITTKFPASTTLADFTWNRPVPKPFQPVIKQVAGSKGNTYIIKSTPSGKWECSCSGYTFRRTCKHIKGV
jgi:hypothetical protein